MSFLNDVTPHKAWSKWHVQIYRLLHSSGVFLSTLQGFPKPRDLEFLVELKNLRSVVIEFPLNTISDVTALGRIKSLENLNLLAKTKKTVDLSGLPNLNQVYILYSPAIESVFKNQNIKKITVLGYPYANLEHLASLTGAKKLSLLDPVGLTSLKGIEGLGNLDVLNLDYESKKQCLEDVSAYSNLSRAPQVFINGEKLYRAKDMSDNEVAAIIDRLGAHRVDTHYVPGRNRVIGKEYEIDLKRVRIKRTK